MRGMAFGSQAYYSSPRHSRWFVNEEVPSGTCLLTSTSEALGRMFEAHRLQLSCHRLQFTARRGDYRIRLSEGPTFLQHTAWTFCTG